jgi:UDP-N-acetylglucosamine 2-epimerase
VRKLKVMTIVGTRPEIIRLSRVIPKLDQHCDHVLVHTGQNYDYELNGVFFSDLGIRKPDVFLEAAGATAAETIGQVIIAADKAMEVHKPEALLLLGDTNMEAGNRCFDSRVPEEINRRIVDHTSDINLTYSDIAREYLLREGLPPDQVIKTGSPMREVIEYYLAGADASKVLNRLELSEQSYFLVSSHREENVDSHANLQRLLNVMNAVAERFGLPVIMSTHPRTRKRMDAMEVVAHPLVQFHKPFGFLDYIRLQTSARAVLSDSGTITEESSILNFPALNLRDVQERPEGFEEATVMFVGLDLDRTLQALGVLESQPRGENRMLTLVKDYEATNVSDKVLRIILSYTDFINRKVWRKA